MYSLLPKLDRIQAFLQRHTHTIISHPVCAFFFGLAAASCLGVWFSGGEMFIVVPVLILGWVFAAIAWWWAPNLSAGAKAACIVISALPLVTEGYILRRHFSNDNLTTGALINIAPQQFSRLDASNYGFPVALTNIGDLPLLDRDWMIATKFSPTVLSKEEEDAVPFFASSSTDKINYWKKQKVINSVQSVMGIGKTILAAMHVEQFDLTPSQIEDVQSGHEKAYVFFLLKYTDSKTPKDQFYIARYCARYSPPAAFTPCQHPNFMKQVEYRD